MEINIIHMQQVHVYMELNLIRRLVVYGNQLKTHARTNVVQLALTSLKLENAWKNV